MTMITVQLAEHFRQVPADLPKLEELVRAVCGRFAVAEATVSIGVVDDAEMIRLNRRFLKREGSTDCLSFDLSDAAAPGTPRIFDLIVNGERAIHEAARRGHSSQAELALYIAHGLLHHMGYDDATPQQAREMHRIEDEILQHLGYGFVYNTDVKASQGDAPGDHVSRGTLKG